MMAEQKEYIEREKVVGKSFLAGLVDKRGHISVPTTVVLVSDINKLSAADVTPIVPARWRKIGYGRLTSDGYEVKYQCSACGFVVTEQPTEPENYVFDNYNACPKCFADMRVKKQEE